MIQGPLDRFLHIFSFHFWLNLHDQVEICMNTEYDSNLLQLSSFLLKAMPCWGFHVWNENKANPSTWATGVSLKSIFFLFNLSAVFLIRIRGSVGRRERMAPSNNL